MSRVLKFEVPPGKPVLRGHDHFWAVMLDLDQRGPWSVTAILARCKGAHRSTVGDYVRRLVAGGFVMEDEQALEGKLYRLSRNQRATPRLRRDGSVGIQGRGQTAMWNVIRGPIGRDGFTVNELALYASTATVEIARASASSYVKHLAQAGYFMPLRKGKPGQPARYRLIAKMGGPLPPLILRSQIVFDQNLNEAVGPVVARESE